LIIERKDPPEAVVPVKNVDIILTLITFEIHLIKGALLDSFFEDGMLTIGKEKR